MGQYMVFRYSSYLNVRKTPLNAHAYKSSEASGETFGLHLNSCLVYATIKGSGEYVQYGRLAWACVAR